MDVTPAVDSADASARAAAAAEQAETSWTCATWNVLADGLAQGGGWLYVRLQTQSSAELKPLQVYKNVQPLRTNLAGKAQTL